MALYADGSYEDVLAQLTDGLSWSSRWSESWSPPSKSAIFQARARLGAEPLAALFSRVAHLLATEGTPGAFLAGRRLVAIDGTCFDVADTLENDAHFGRPGVNKGERSAFPNVRVVALAECATHAIFDAETRPLHFLRDRALQGAPRSPHPGHARPRRPRLLRLPPVQRGRRHRRRLVLAGEIEPQAPAPSDPLRRLLPRRRSPLVGTRDGTRRRLWCVSSTTPWTTAAGTPRSTGSHHDPRPGRGAGGYPRRLLRRALGDRVVPRRAEDPPKRPADRAAVEVARPGHPGDLGASALPLRDPHAHVGGSRRRREDPDRAPRSSPRCASPADRSLNGALFPPEDARATDATWRQAIMQLLRRLNPIRRRRSNPHVIKRKMPKWHVKRAHHRHWPQPTGPPRIMVRRCQP